MLYWVRIRIAILILLGCGSAVVLGRSLVTRAPLDPSFPAFSFPHDAPLPDWQADESFPLPKSDVEKADNAVKARYYSAGDSLEVQLRFIADTHTLHVADPLLQERMLPAGYLPLDVGLHFLVDSIGRVKRNYNRDSSTNGTVEVTKRDRAGSYGLWEDGRRVHLSAIIVSDGRSLITPAEFVRSAYAAQMTPRRVMRWFKGEALLPDKRCVLVDVSVIRSGLTRLEAGDKLERAWVAWDGWCAPRFAQLCDGIEHADLGAQKWAR